MSEQLQRPITLEDLRARRDEILSLAEKYGAYNVRIFGSVARGEANVDSDIDVLVNFQSCVSLYELSGLKQALEIFLHHPVDVIEEHEDMRESFRRRVLKDAVML